MVSSKYKLLFQGFIVGTFFNILKEIDNCRVPQTKTFLDQVDRLCAICFLAVVEL